MQAAHSSSAPPAGADRSEVWTVAVLGNPNTGKTTLFNALTGLTQHTGNYPGVTVEGALGTILAEGRRIDAIDLPGSYSLSPRAPDEMVAVSVLLGRGAAPPHAVLCVLDACHLDRNLYLLTQVQDVGLPVVVALTMMDVARRQGLEIDVPMLAQRLGVPVVPVHATRREGIAELKHALLATIERGSATPRRVGYPSVFLEAVARLAEGIDPRGGTAMRFLVERALIDRGGFVEGELVREFGAGLQAGIERTREELERQLAPLPQLEVETRYRTIASLLQGVIRSASAGAKSWTDPIDDLVTHRVWGVLIFLAAMAMTFQAIFTWAVPLMELIDTAFMALGDKVGALLPEGPLRSLVVDGVIGGVGAVVVFVPQIAILFALITILEDSGYMARAAFLMDRVMASFGLSGRSFIPLLSSFACAVPGIMSARSIEDRRDRIVTIVIAPLMSCSARLPVYVLFISAFVPAETVGGVVGLQGLTLFVLYLLGMLIAPPIAWLLKRTALRGPAVPFLLELPPYKIPAWRVVAFRMYDRSWAFVRRAGTIILASTILVWALSYYPRPAEITDHYAGLRAQASEEEKARLDALEAGDLLRHSFLGQAGHVIEPLVRPLGWDWKIGMAVIASFPAREVVIAALGTIYNLGSSASEESVELREAMRAERWPDGRPVYTTAVALSIMVFFALCCQCAATLATIRRETGSWGYPVFTFVYMTSLAYVAALVTYQLGHRLG